MNLQKKCYSFSSRIFRTCPTLVISPNQMSDWREFFFVRGNWGFQPNDVYPLVVTLQTYGKFLSLFPFT